MSSSRLEHLIFSTRAARPESGTELNREIIAWSPGVDDQVKSFFAVRADIAGSVLQRRELAPVYTFSRLAPESWLVCRAVSLGLYRKGSHQLLVQGVVLRREHLDWLDGNPFLLAHDAAREAGFRFSDEHPGGSQLLDPLRLDPEIAGLAPRLNRERLEQLSDELGDWDEDFAALFELLLRPRRHTASIAAERPDSRLVEWLLLHLHPHDRAEISFHSWYTHSRAVDYRLMLATEDEVPLLRQQFAELDLWPRSAARSEPGGIGVLSRRLRRASCASYLEAVRRYRLTHVSSRRMPPLATGEAIVALRHELGEPLAPREKEVLEVLARRSAAYLAYHAHHLARSWESGVAAFEADLETRQASEWKVGPEQVGEALASLRDGSREQRWAFAVLLQSNLIDDDPEWGPLILSAWHRLAPPDRFLDLLGLFATVEQVVHAEPYLEAYVEMAARDAIRMAADQGGDLGASYWLGYLRWLAGQGRPVAAPAARIERLLDSAPDAVAAAGYRQLTEACFAAGAAVFAYRVIFQKETRLLSGEAYRVRVRSGVGRLLGSDGVADEVLRSFLGEERMVEATLTAMADWLSVQERPAAGWRRWRELLQRQGTLLGPETADICATFLARLANSPLAARVGESLGVLTAAVPSVSRRAFLDAVVRAVSRKLTDVARRCEDPPTSACLSSAIASLIEARLSHLPGAAADQALAELLLHGRVVSDYASGASSSALRPALEGYLHQLYLDQRLELLAADRRWSDLLLDELIRHPPEDAESDARYRAYLHVVWRRWSEDSPRHGIRRPAEIRVQRMLTWRALGKPLSLHLHHEWMREAVPDLLQTAAAVVLGDSFPSSPGGRQTAISYRSSR